MKVYYKIIAFHQNNGLCTILPYDEQNHQLGEMGRFPSKEDAYSAFESAIGYRITPSPKFGNNDLMRSLPQRGYHDVSIMEFFELS